MQVNVYLFVMCSAAYATLAVLISIQTRRRTDAILVGCCVLTAVWAASAAIWPGQTLYGLVGILDLLRLLAWYAYLLHLYARSEVGPRWQLQGFGLIAIGALALSFTLPWTGIGRDPFSLLSFPIFIRLVVCVCELLLIENLYLNLPENARWHVALPCVLLGGLACFDILVTADTVLFHRPSVPLASARAIGMVIVAPLLVLAASRGQRWTEPVRLSRTAVFHSATLVLSGSVLLALALAGELLRRFDETWGWIAELSLVFAGVIGLLLFLSSRSARSLMHRVVVHHFFADRYDYRVQWLHCIKTLSGTGTNEQTSLHTRAIRAVADVVNSPNGNLFLREAGTDALVWAGSWNMPAGTTLSAAKVILELLSNGDQIIDFSAVPEIIVADVDQFGTIWLAVPLLHSANVVGMVILGPPRVAFRVDQEVFDLLKTVGREVATYLAEQQATEIILQTRDLHDYSKRFAFVAHDIKNISSQLGLLVSNAEHHLDNPEFQRDMVDTVQASVRKIEALLKRLDNPAPDTATASLRPVPRLEALVATYQRVRKAALNLVHDGSTGSIAMGPDAFDAAMTHLLNNAVEAAPGQPVQIRIEHEADRIMIEIKDQGRGMSPAFIRDELFAPFKTSKQSGSGIGAFQARELIKGAGGELIVTSQQGIGTSIKIVLTRTDQQTRSRTKSPLFSLTGEYGGR